MNDIQNAFQQSLLAEAAYANLASAVGNSAQLLAALDVANKETYGGTFSTAQATEFVKHWAVRDHLPNTESGFSATLFEQEPKGSENQRGQHQLTSEPSDMPRRLRIQRSAAAGEESLA